MDDCNHITLWKKQTGDRKKIHGCQGIEEKENEQVEHRGSEGRETTLCDTVRADTCHYTFVNTHRMNNTKSEL